MTEKIKFLSFVKAVLALYIFSWGAAIVVIKAHGKLDLSQLPGRILVRKRLIDLRTCWNSAHHPADPWAVSSKRLLSNDRLLGSPGRHSHLCRGQLAHIVHTVSVDGSLAPPVSVHCTAPTNMPIWGQVLFLPSSEIRLTRDTDKPTSPAMAALRGLLAQSVRVRLHRVRASTLECPVGCAKPSTRRCNRYARDRRPDGGPAADRQRSPGRFSSWHRAASPLQDSGRCGHRPAPGRR